MADHRLTGAVAISDAEARRLALAAQGFRGGRDEARSSWPRARATIERMGLLQIDSVNALVRTHYLPIYSRLGNYDRERLDRHGFAPGKNRQLFEYWAHEASLLPLDLHPLFRWRMARAERFEAGYKSFAPFVRENRDYVRAIEREIVDRGPLAAGDLADPGKRSGHWWGWHNGKRALEFLFLTGRVTASRRGAFERVYDLTERALPPEILGMPTPTENEAIRRLAAIASRALGVATETDIRDYYRLPVVEARTAIAELVEDGALVPAAVESWSAPAYLAAGTVAPKRVSATALVSPFDPIVWHRPRTERLFDFHYRIELYTPAAKRKFGYYVLPFLHRGRLKARVDLRSDRAAGLLVAHGAYSEPGADLDGLVEDLAIELRHLASWLGLGDVKIGDRGALAADLRRAIRRT